MYHHGINITLDELIRARPAKGYSGFAPVGRVCTHQWGSSTSIFKGRGMEFAESRAYQAGDDMRYIDWQVTARTGKAHTKLFQEERERPVQILLDLRAMMHFGSRKRFKSHLAAELAAQFAWVAFDGGDRLGGQILAKDGITAFKASRTRRAVLRFLESIVSKAQTNIQPNVGENVGEAIALSTAVARLRRVCRPGTLVFIISDFHDFADTLSNELSRLAAHTHLTCVQVIDRLDIALPPRGGKLSDGKKTVALKKLTPADLNRYAQAFALRQDKLTKLCKQQHIAYHLLQTTDAATAVLYAPKHSPKPLIKPAKQRGGKHA